MKKKKVLGVNTKWMALTLSLIAVLLSYVLALVVIPGFLILLSFAFGFLPLAFLFNIVEPLSYILWVFLSIISVGWVVKRFRRESGE